MKKLLSAAALAALASAASQASAQVLYDPFNYTAGAQLDANAASPIKNYNTSGTYWGERGTQAGLFTVGADNGAPTLTPPVPGTMGGSAVYPTATTATGRTPNIGFGQTFTSGDIYYSFTLKLPSTGLVSQAGTFAGLLNFAIPTPNSATIFQAGVRYVPVSSTQFRLGMASGNVTQDVATQTFNGGDTVLVVGKYSINPTTRADDSVALWLNPSSFGGTAPTADAAFTHIAVAPNGLTPDSVDAADPIAPMIAAFTMRSYGGNNMTTSGWQIDELRVDSTWAGVTPDGYLQHKFNTAGDGNWSDWSAANWTNHATAPAYATDATTVGHVANFDNGIGASGTVTVDGGGRTVDQINFTNTGSVTIAGDASNALNFKTNASAAQVYGYAGSHTIAAPITTEGNLSFKTAAGASITLSDTVTATGTNKVIGVYGRGTVNLASAERIDDAARLEVRSGTLNVAGNETVAALQLGTSHPNNGVALGNGTLYNGDLASGNITGPGTITASTFELQSGTISAGLVGGTPAVGQPAVGVTKNLAGFVELAGNNSYEGVTRVNSGTLLLSGTNAFPILATLAVPPAVGGAQAVLAIDDNNALGSTGVPTITWLTTGGTSGVLQLNGDFTLRSDAVLTIPSNATMIARFGAGAGNTGTIAHQLSGLNGIGNAGPGTLILDNANTYSGPTGMYAGTLLVSNQTQIGDGSATNDLWFNGGTFKQAANLGVITKDVRMLGAGTFDTAEFDATISGVISDGGALTKTGAARLTLTAVNTHTGRTTVAAGSGPLRITNAQALGASTAAGNTVITGGGALTNLNVLEIDGTLGNLSIPELITVGGKTSTSGGNASSSLTNVAGNNTLTGAVTLGSGGTWYNIQSELGSKLTLAAGAVNTNNDNSNRHVHLRGAGDGEIGGTALTNNAAATTAGAIITLHKHDAGTWTIGVPSSHNGDTTINGGTLAINAESGLGTSTAPILFNGGALRANNAIAFARNATINAGGGAIDTVVGANSIGTVLGTGGFTKAGAGALTANQVKVGGAVAVSGGTLEIPTNGGVAGTLESTGLTVDGILAMNDNDFIVNYTGASPEFTLRDKVKAFRDSLAPGGPAFTSGISYTPGANDRVIAVAEKSEWSSTRTEFNGIPIDDTTIIGKHTYYGDANLDGKVDSNDYVAVDVGLGTGDSWVQGDFNFSGTVTSDDYVAIDTNLGKGVTVGDPLAIAELKAEMIALHTAQFGDAYVQALAIAEEFGYGALVPEPGALSLVGIGAAGLLGRRRRRA